MRKNKVYVGNERNPIRKRTQKLEKAEQFKYVGMAIK